ncbi:hypothetical protein [Bacteriovorax sp. Seq25_V]|uniref:hypothetical protein n=1 Tax=Bacteriovorax sp. Seq25_V TaxID=1201288 RepID=UPI000389F64E|nr:hypothetical protein [Bacteriovorax sp. Seq25_V]EQC47676.1 hypothetical protein M900_A0181 [Bacteriovorax sp. Seq25_V]
MNSLIKSILVIFALSPLAFGKSEFAAPFSYVHKANCLGPVYEHQSYGQFLTKSIQSKGKHSLSLAGFVFQNEAQSSIDLFKKLVEEEIVKKLSKHEKFESRIRDAQNCKSIECALTELFNDEDQLVKSAYLLNTFNLNVSPYANKDADLLGENELDTIITATRLIPKHMLPIWDNKRLAKHIKDGIGYYKSFMIYANASIDLYAPWFKELDYDGKAYSIFHEFSHNLSYMMNMPESSTWQAMSKWQDTPNGWRYDINRIVSGYGASAPSEDAAESIVAYRINPELLKKVNRQKYDFIRDYIFLGEEFDSELNCGKTPVLSHIKALMSSQATSKLSSVAINECKIELQGMLMSRSGDQKFEKCITKTLTSELIKSSKYPHFKDAKNALSKKILGEPKLDPGTKKSITKSIYEEQLNYLTAKAQDITSRDCGKSVEDFSEENKTYLGDAKFSLTWDLRSYCYQNMKTLKKKGFSKILRDYLMKRYKEL